MDEGLSGTAFTLSGVLEVAVHLELLNLQLDELGSLLVSLDVVGSLEVTESINIFSTIITEDFSLFVNEVF